jgi:hypothetical protein
MKMLAARHPRLGADFSNQCTVIQKHKNIKRLFPKWFEMQEDIVPKLCHSLLRPAALLFETVKESDGFLFSLLHISRRTQEESMC